MEIRTLKKFIRDDIYSFINRPHNYCAYCGQPDFIEWSASGKNKIEDYAVKLPNGTKVK